MGTSHRGSGAPLRNKHPDWHLIPLGMSEINRLAPEVGYSGLEGAGPTTSSPAPLPAVIPLGLNEINGLSETRPTSAQEAPAEEPWHPPRSPPRNSRGATTSAKMSLSSGAPGEGMFQIRASRSPSKPGRGLAHRRGASGWDSDRHRREPQIRTGDGDRTGSTSDGITETRY